jgi:hypothetical protein
MLCRFFRWFGSLFEASLRASEDEWRHSVSK